MATLLADVTTLFTSILSWLSSIIDFVVGEPILMVFVLIVLASIVIRICKRWIPGL